MRSGSWIQTTGPNNGHQLLFKHMKAEEVKLDESINHVIWARGIQKIPSKITVKAVKDDDGVVEATLAE